MRFAFTDDQRLLRKAVADLLDRECTSEQLRAAWERPDGRVPGLWRKLADIGLPALVVPERYGGLGLTAVDLVGPLEESGRAALPEPLVETVVAAGALAAAGGPYADAWLPRVCAGDAVVSTAAGPLVSHAAAADVLVPHASAADLLVLPRDGELHAVERAAVVLEPRPGADRGRPLARATWQPDVATRIGGGAAVARLLDGGALATAAQLVGVAQGMLDQAVRYAGQRAQFGRPIGAFQAVKHQLADSYVAVVFARPVVHRAAWSVAHDLPTRTRDVSAAKHAAITAARRAARTALQVHGAIGYTYEHDLHMWLKRTWSLTPAWGDAAYHLARVATAVLDGDQPRVP